MLACSWQSLRATIGPLQDSRPLFHYVIGISGVLPYLTCLLITGDFFRLLGSITLLPRQPRVFARLARWQSVIYRLVFPYMIIPFSTWSLKPQASTLAPSPVPVTYHRITAITVITTKTSNFASTITCAILTAPLPLERAVTKPSAGGTTSIAMKTKAVPPQSKFSVLKRLVILKLLR